MNENARPATLRFFPAYVVGSLWAIFYLPTLAPVHPTASDSYLFGYNNRVGVVLLLLLVTIGAVWTRGLGLSFSEARVSERVPLRTLVVTLIAVLLGCGAMYLFAGRFGGWGESSYGIDRAWLLSQGHVPYRDFEWPFGPALIYVPLLISRLFSMGIVNAYYLFWAINCLLGTVLLFAVVNRIDYPTRYKKTIYLLIYCSWFLCIVNMGTHYALVRYTCPLYFVLVVQRCLKSEGIWQRVKAACVAIVFTLVLLTISPEVAIAFAFACACIFLLPGRGWSDSGLAIFAGLLAALGVVFLVALKLRLLDTVRASGGGADSFPISFAPYMLLFFAVAFLCGCYVFLRLSERRVDDNTVGLIAFSLPMMAAALARCDPAHVLFNGLGVFLASMFYVSSSRIAWRWYRRTFIVFFLLIPAVGGMWMFLPALRRCGVNYISEVGDSPIKHALIGLGRTYIATFSGPAKRAKWEKALDAAERSEAPKAVDLAAIYPTWHGAFLAPLGYRPNGIGSYLSSEVDYGRFEAFENANTADAIYEKLAEIKDHPEKAVLLPDHYEDVCRVDIPAERFEMSMLFAFPYLGRAVHTESVRQPVCDYLAARYRLEQAPAPEDFGYGLWVAKPAGAVDR